MKIPQKPLPLFFPFICLLFILPVSKAQNTNCSATTLEDFFACYGGPGAFTPQSIAAITTFIQAEDALKAGDYLQAKQLVENVFTTYPKGSNSWWSVFNDPNGANIGTPHAYYGLRMIEDIVDFHLHGNPAVEAQTAYMKVVLVGCSEGIQPTTEAELANGTGPFVRNTLAPTLRTDDYRIVKQSFDFFSTYVTAITGGRLEIKVEVLELPDVCMQVNVSTTRPYFATGSTAPVWEALSDEIQASTDWWWILYPSHVPEFPTFDDEAFITGGMGQDGKGGPAFIIDDKWITRKPAHLGKGIYSDIERRIYLPQWFQHEFYHHLYRAYPELRLEVNGHDWFNRSFWAPDFEGQFEPDYYAETLHKRLQPDCVPLVTKLITRREDGFQDSFGTLSMEELIGPYSLDNVQNAWHIGEIIQAGNQYFWRNNANVQWEITPNLAEGRLETGADSPYPGQDFFIELYKTGEGQSVPGVTGVKFQGEIYHKRFDLLRESIPIEVALGLYERIPVASSQHTGTITKRDGQFFWENGNGDSWSLTPNYEDECFILNSDSPTPGQKIQLIFTEDGCGIHVLGFQYEEDYYWRPKQDERNGSPSLINPLADLVLQKDFGSYSIDLSEVFTDPEEDVLLYFASSGEPTLLSTEITDQQLVLSGGAVGTIPLLVTAVDANGGRAVDEFTVTVEETSVSLDEEPIGQRIFLYPNPTRDYLYVEGELSNYRLSLFSAEGSLHREFSPSGNKTRIDVSHLSSGMYLMLIRDVENGQVKMEKVMKY